MNIEWVFFKKRQKNETKASPPVNSAEISVMPAHLTIITSSVY